MANGLSRVIVVGLALTAFLGIAVAPTAYMLGASLRAGVGSTEMASLFEARQIVLAWNSARLAVGAALLATLIGVPLGLLLGRIEMRGKWLLRLLLTMPLVLPPYVLALAWISLGGPAGFGVRALGVDPFSTWTYSLPAATLVLGVAGFPLVMLATEASVRMVSARQEEAALLVAGPFRTFASITLPAIAPAIAAAALITFVLALSDFGVPSLLRVRVYTAEVFTAFAALYDFGRATLLTLPLIGAALLVGMAIAGPLGRHLIVSQRTTVPARRVSLVGWRHTAAMLPVWSLVFGVVALPIASLAAAASPATSIAALVGASSVAIATSLLAAAACASAAVTVAVWLGHWRARSAGPRTCWLTDALLIALFAVPSTVVGIGLIGVWNRPGARGFVYASAAMLVLAPLARFLPMTVLMLSAAVRQIPRSSEEAASVAGARWMRTMWWIVLPQMRRALGATWMILFILAFGELGATILVAPPGESTLPIRVYTLIANAPASHVATLALLQVAVVVIPLVLLAWSVRTRGPGAA